MPLEAPSGMTGTILAPRRKHAFVIATLFSAILIFLRSVTLKASRPKLSAGATE